MNSAGSVPAVFRMATAYWTSQAIYVAAKLGIADALGDSAKTADEIASATGTNEKSLVRLLRALVALGVLAEDDHRRFRLTVIGGPLQSGIPGSLRFIILTLGEEHYHAWGNLIESIRGGKPAFNETYQQPLFEYLRQNPTAAGMFNAGMNDLTSQVALALMLAYDFTTCRVVADIGGGQGVLLDALLKSNPALSGILFDYEEVVAATSSRVEERRKIVAGDFFEFVPEGADTYLLKNVLHDWSDDRAIRILKKCRHAMGLHAKLLVIELVLPLTDDPAFGSLLDLNMLVMSGGRERTLDEYRRLFEASGFSLVRVIPTLAPLSILEALPL
jgi:O-methyltransferase domain/Dimerisation domain